MGREYDSNNITPEDRKRLDDLYNSAQKPRQKKDNLEKLKKRLFIKMKLSDYLKNVKYPNRIPMAGQGAKIDNKPPLLNSGMYGWQIDEILKPYAPTYVGIYAIDQLNMIPFKKKFGCIINLDKSTGRGTHWVSMFCDAYVSDSPNSQSINFFDSYGDDAGQPIKKFIYSYIEKLRLPYLIKYKTNGVQFQSGSKSSSNCGWFACKWLIDMMENKPFAECSTFSEVAKGEKMIKAFKKKFTIL